MAEVNLIIDGRGYGIACDDGQEQRVKQLGKYVDDRLRQLTGGGNATNKAQSMVLTSLLLADEVFDLTDRLDKSNQQNETASTDKIIAYQGLNPQDEQNITNLIGMMADKVEHLTARAKAKRRA